MKMGNEALSLTSGVRPLVVELTGDDEVLNFLTGLETQTFALESLQSKTLRVSVTDMLKRISRFTERDEFGALRFYERDAFFGTRLRVRMYPQGKPNEIYSTRPCTHIYRYVDALDAVTAERAVDGILDSPDTLADGVPRGPRHSPCRVSHASHNSPQCFPSRMPTSLLIARRMRLQSNDRIEWPPRPDRSIRSGNKLCRKLACAR